MAEQLPSWAKPSGGERLDWTKHQHVDVEIILIERVKSFITLDVMNIRTTLVRCFEESYLNFD